ncbi:thioredoxin-dependent thiol peroxidase [Methanolapillus millepedarum]|uniref:thioredoxin-dependent peroxiredoxin n=1 Tax=Methanolapillus millepedarum TaxID=3028296 RepID=A0AA96ZVS2_9EURY|nr:Putative peroxiredoxin bcp [Methanosarcinaceae archaeon Ac7]
MTSSIKEGDGVPNVCLPNQESKKTCLTDFLGKWVVFYFYPKDNTGGCTKEAVSFSEKKDDFERENAAIIGVSKDSVASHQKFTEKRELKIILLSDEELTANIAFDVWRLKKFMGKENMGTVRTTFLINPDGKIAKIWNNVKVDGHVEAVLEELRKQKTK